MPGHQHAPDPEDARVPLCGCGALLCQRLAPPVPVDECHPEIGSEPTFWSWPFLGPLLFENESSDARDHAANERTFLSYLRLSVYMSVVAVAITFSFHLNQQATPLELRMARPLGLIFWLLSASCLVLGFSNYIRTINMYSRKAAIVQFGWRTQSILSLIAISIVSTCVILLVVEKARKDLQCTRVGVACAKAAISYYSSGILF